MNMNYEKKNGKKEEKHQLNVVMASSCGKLLLTTQTGDWWTEPVRRPAC